MLKTLKNYQILDLVEAFTKIGESKIKSNKKFSYALILNDESIKPFVKAMQEIASPSENYADYENERNNIIREYAKVDGDGNIVLNDQRGVVFKDGADDTVRDLLTALNDNNKDILDERTNDINEYNELISKDVEVAIHMIDLDDVPEEIGEDLFLVKLLMPMIG